MSYRELYRLTAGASSHRNRFGTSPLSEILFRRCAYFLAPLFLMTPLSSNQVTFMGLLIGMVSATVIVKGGPQALGPGLALLFLAIVFDYVDGSMARFRKASNFYGKFIDGMIDVVNLCALRFALSYLALVHYRNENLLWAGFICAVLTPFQHLFFDRYSTFARWINQVKGSAVVETYIRPKLALKAMNWVTDIQYFLLVGTLFNFEPFLWPYFLLNIFAAVFYILGHIRYASSNMRITDEKI